MSDPGDLSRELQELRERVRILEMENDRLAERAEDSLLLGLISERLAGLETRDEVLETGLEQVSLLKDIPYCLFGVREDQALHVLQAYLSGSHESLAGTRLCLSFQVGDLELFLRDPEALPHLGLPTTPAVALLIPCVSRSLPSGLFLFADVADPERLLALQPLLRRVAEMMVARLDLLPCSRSSKS